MDLSVVDTTLHDSPDFVIHRTEIWAVWGHSLDARKFGVSWRSSSTVARARRGVRMHCPAGTKSIPVLRIAGSSMTSLWRRDRSSIEEVSKRYHQNILLCNHNEITAWITYLFNSFFLWRNVCQSYTQMKRVQFFWRTVYDKVSRPKNLTICHWH